MGEDAEVSRRGHASVLGSVRISFKKFAERIRIAFTGLGKGNDLIGDGLLDIVGAIAGSERHASHLQGASHGARRLRSASNFSPFRKGVIGIG